MREMSAMLANEAIDELVKSNVISLGKILGACHNEDIPFSVMYDGEEMLSISIDDMNRTSNSLSKLAVDAIVLFSEAVKK